MVVVGGGINGCGIARDLAGRGAKVVLCEKDDLASHTSSSSTKLIHGGLRYLEYYEFSLVRKALAEREVLLKSAPHIMRPLRFVMPHDPGMRPVWMIRAGLFLYDHLARREVLPGSRTVNLHGHPAGAPLKREFTKGFIYSDGWVDDARLVVLNAIDAAERGAHVVTRCRCIHAERSADRWLATLQDDSGAARRVRSRVLVNAAGPWASQFLRDHVPAAAPKPLRLVKGSHIVVRRLFEHDHGYIFQTSDGRVVFALPFVRDFTLIGTTDQNFVGDPGSVKPSADEIAYLCAAANGYFREQIRPADVVWSFAGVRSLYDDGSEKAEDTTRDYVLDLDRRNGEAPLLNIYGGKITTYRRLAEHALDLLADGLSTGPAWTKDSHLPGGEFPHNGLEALIAKTRRSRPFLSEEHARRLVRAYGTRVERVLGPARRLEDLGPCLGADLTAAEVRYLMEHEWARTEDDVLWRRSKLGLCFSAEQRERLARFMADRTGSSAD